MEIVVGDCADVLLCGGRRGGRVAGWQGGERRVRVWRVMSDGRRVVGIEWCIQHDVLLCV